MPKPKKLRVPHDEDHFEHVGRLPDGTQFMAFVTGAFPTGEAYYSGDDWESQKSWLAVIHCFDQQGRHLRSESRRGGFESEGQEAANRQAFDLLKELLAELGASGEPELGDIQVQLFSVEIDGVTHGLLNEQSEEELEPDEEREEWVMLEPHDIMSHPPWDGGEYST